MQNFLNIFAGHSKLNELEAKMLLESQL